jgi:hypothetical protein
MTPEESKAFHKAQGQRYQAEEPTFGFHGHAIGVLEVKRRLAGRTQNVLRPLRGMSGASKTTFLQHLARWRQSSHFVAEVFSFSFHQEWAWRRQQIMNGIARQLQTNATIRWRPSKETQKRIGSPQILGNCCAQSRRKTQSLICVNLRNLRIKVDYYPQITQIDAD